MATVKPIRIAGGQSLRGSSQFVRLELDQKSLQRGYAMLDRYRDAPLQKRMSKAALAAAKVLEGPIRDASPVSNDKDPGGLRRSVRARPWQVRKTFVEGKGWRSRSTSEANVGPVGGKRGGGGHGRLVIRGHRIVTRGGRDTGRRTRKNPYVDMVAQRHYRRAIAEMRKAIFDRGMQEDLARRVLFGRNAG
jgi:hypothetical protein